MLPSAAAGEPRSPQYLLLAAVAPAVAAQELLRAGVDATYAPFAYPSPTGELQGFNIDLIAEIGKRLGRRIEMKTSSVEDLADLLQQDRIDVIAGPPVTVTLERATQMLFTQAYLNSDLQLLTRSDRAPDPPRPRGRRPP